MDSRELAQLRKQTAQFIKENPTDVILKRDVRVNDGAGGFTTEPGQPIATQTVRLVPQNQQITQNQTVDSTEIHPQYVMIGEWDADVQVGDKFTLNNRDYSVQFVKLKTAQSYETWAEVEYRG